MKNYCCLLGLVLLCTLGTAPLQPAQAQEPISEIIKAAVTKVIVAMDLQVQRLQNQTIWLQQAQKVVENSLSELRLAEIADWSDRQRQLYAGYYDELWQVRSAIADYQRVRAILQRQAALVSAYQQAYALFRQDAHFSPDERVFMECVYAGLLEESARHLDQLLLVLRPGATQMSDGARLALLEQAADRIEENYNNLRAFTAQNIQLSLQRAKASHNLQQTLRLYGLPDQ